MSATIELKYYNSFLLKKTIRDDATPADANSDYPSIVNNPHLYPQYPLLVDNTSDANNWFVEESRIRGGFNNTEIDLGVKAYVAEDEKLFRIDETGIIYSGIYNYRTSTNDTNVFSVGDDITKRADPRYGSIQKLYAEDSNLLILQESKTSVALIEKSAIYSAEGNATITSSDQIIGKIQPYSGDFGIGKNPESFAKKGYRSYFSDVPNGSVMRLSRDGLTEISKKGMDDFFEDEFQRISSSLKRILYDITWVVPTGVPTTTITFTGDNVGEVEFGMSIEGILGYTNIYVDDITNIVETDGVITSLDITFSEEVTVTSGSQSTTLQAVKYVKDRVVGGFDNKYDSYVMSIEYNPPSRS